MKVVYLPITEIKPHGLNNRENSATVEALKRLIPKVGFNVPLVLDKDNEIVKGDARYKAGLALGMKTLPCIISENTAEVNDLDRIADNRISELAEWDYTLLEYELSGIEPELKEMGLQFNIIHQHIHEINNTDIEGAENAQANIGQHQAKALLTVNCPKCGGYFEYTKD